MASPCPRNSSSSSLSSISSTTALSPNGKRGVVDSAKNLVKKLRTSTSDSVDPLVASTSKPQSLGKCLMNLIRIVFPAKTSKPDVTAFPHQVQTMMHAAENSEGCKNWSLSTVLQQLGDWMEQKQGFMMVRADGQRSMAEEIQACFGSGESMRIDEHCVITSIKPATMQNSVAPGSTPSDEYQVITYIASVFDDRLGWSVDVPITEIHIPDADAKTSKDLGLGRKLMEVKSVMDEHLELIHPAFIDSPYSPPIICPSNPRLGHLLSTQEECLSRLYRREYTSDARFDWITFFDETLIEINPAKTGLQDEEGSGVEQFISVLTGVNHRTLPGRSIGAHADLGPHSDYYADYVRAYKRHLPESDTAPANSEPAPVVLPPTTPTLAPEVNSAMAKRTTSKIAYKEPAVQMQCALQAVNGFFQGGVISAPDIAPLLAEQYIRQSNELGLNLAQAGGLAHPTVLSAMLQGQSLEVDKSIFGKGNDLLLEQDHAEQWKQLVNLSPMGQGKNWVQNAAELDSINKIRLTPDMWVSSQRGLQMHDLADYINKMRKAGCESWAGLDLPARVELSEMPDRKATLSLGGQIEEAFQRMRQAKGSRADFPIVVRTGASNAAGHYFTLVPDADGKWLSLNADGTTITGEQHCEVWAEPGQLGEALFNNGASQVIHGELRRI